MKRFLHIFKYAVLSVSLLSGGVAFGLQGGRDTGREDEWQWVVFKLTPPDAVVTLDGERLVTEDGTAKRFVVLGEHKYVITRPDYQDAGGTVSVDDPDEKKIVEVSLKPFEAAGSLNVDSSPGGASVILDGEIVGDTPLFLKRVKPGFHTVILEKDGYADFVDSVTVQSGKMCGISVKMERPAPQDTDPGTACAAVGFKDFGLSVNWAECNLGASSPEETGDYFAWGEIEPYYAPGGSQERPPQWNEGKEAGYDFKSYKYCEGKKILTKYNTSDKRGEVDDMIQLEPGDDPAVVASGGKWRMPTIEEWDELRTKCVWLWVSNFKKTGVSGYVVTLKKHINGENRIFIPACGYRHGTGLTEVGVSGNYWSSSLKPGKPDRAYCQSFIQTEVIPFSYLRSTGACIRPVCDKR